MERELINETDQLKKDYYQLEYKGQNVEKSPLFKKWYDNRLKEIKTENERRSKIDEFAYDYNNSPDVLLLCIFYCPNCINYTTCSYERDFSCVECNKCKAVFCPGCNYIRHKEYKYGDGVACLKGYWILWWLRTKNCRSDLIRSNLCFYIMHIFFCIFLTPLYLGFICFFIGLFNHKIFSDEKIDEMRFPAFIYSILFGLLMFPFIITFIPIMVLVLIPGIFNHNYYIYVFIAYVTAVMPGYSVLRTFYDSE